MRGRATPARRKVAVVASIAATMRSCVSMSATSRSGSCEVTRAFHRSSSLLYSLHAPFQPSRSEAQRISSGYGLPARLNASLLNGVNMMPSKRRALAASERLAEIAHRERAAFGGRLRHRDGRRIEMRRSTKTGRAGCAAGLIERRDRLDIERDAGGLFAQRQHAAVADHRDGGEVQQILLAQQFGQQFRADAGGIAHRDHEARRFVPCVILSLQPGSFSLRLHIAFNPEVNRLFAGSGAGRDFAVRTKTLARQGIP